MGIIPSGTGNLLARNVDIPLEDPAAAMVAALTGTDHQVDVGRLEAPGEPLDSGNPEMFGVGQRHGVGVDLGDGLFDLMLVADTMRAGRELRSFFLRLPDGGLSAGCRGALHRALRRYPAARRAAADPAVEAGMTGMNPLNAAACCPFRKISSTWGTAGANAGWKAAPALPARQCTGQVSPKSGSWPSGAQW